MNRKVKIFVFIFVLILSNMIISFGDSVDYSNHWAQKDIEFLMDKKIINGYDDGSFKPDSEITRAEFIKIINRVFGFTGKKDIFFADVKETDWFYKDVEIAAYAGYISGYEDNTLRPNKLITRQEAAKIISEAYNLSKSNDSLDFKDKEQIDSWARDYVISVSSSGIMNGYSDNSFKPSLNITRAETARLICNASGDIFNLSGEFSNIEKTNVTINRCDVILKSVTINGNLYLTEGIGNGSVTLENVIIKGRLVITGGGKDTIHIINSEINETYVSKKGDLVKVILEKVSANTIIASDNSIIVIAEGTSLENLIINGESQISVEKSANVKNIKVNSKNVEITSEGNIYKIEASEDVKINGKIYSKGIINFDEKDSGSVVPSVPGGPDKPEEPEDKYNFTAKLGKDSYSVNETIIVAGTVQKDNIGLKDINITFKMYGEYIISLDQFITNFDGKFEYTFMVPAETEAGSYTILLRANEPINETIELTINICDEISIDKSKLLEKIIEAQSLNRDEYIESSWDILQDALKTAENIFNRDKVTQIQVDDACKKLNDAIKSLVKKATIYRIELEIKINEAKLLIKEEYTDESWAELQLILSIAENILADQDSTYVELKNAIIYVSEAINSLEKVEKADKTLLREELEKIALLDENEYTEESWAILQEVVEAAELILLDKEAAQVQVDRILDELKDAVRFLVKKGEESDVQVTFSITKCVIAPNGYTPDLLITTTGLEEEEILSVVVSSDNKDIVLVTQRPEWPDGGYPKSRTRAFGRGMSPGETKIVAVVTSVDGRLFRAECKVTVITSASKSLLNAKIKEAKTLSEIDYTKETWNAFKLALSNADAVSKNDFATQEEVDNVLAELIAAMDNLKRLANKTSLGIKINEAKKLIESDYTEKSWEEFVIVLNAAETVYHDVNATQEEVDNALAALVTAIDNLEIIQVVEKTALKSRIDYAKTLVEEDYTEATWKVFEIALNEAEVVYQNTDATQEEVDNALIALNNAISNLENAEEIIEDIGLIYRKEGNNVQLVIESYDIESENYYRALIGDNISTIDYYGWFGSVTIDISIDEFENLLRAAGEKIKIEILDDENGTNVIERKTVILRLHVNKSALKEQIDYAKTLVEAQYTEATWKVFETALNAAEAVYQNINATQQEVDNALIALNNAISNLENAEETIEDIQLIYYDNGGKVGLMIGLNNLESENYFRAVIGNHTSSISKYEAYGIVDFEIGMKEFETLLRANGDKILFEILDDQNGTNVIGRKWIFLKATVNRGELQALIGQAQDLNEEDYTVETWESLQIALNNAISINKNINATQEEVDNAAEALREAIDGLIVKPKEEVNITLEYFDASWDGSGIPVMFEIDVSEYYTTASKFKVILGSYTSTIASLYLSDYPAEMEISIDEFEDLLAEIGKVTLVLLAYDGVTEIERLEIVPISID